LFQTNRNLLNLTDNPKGDIVMGKKGEHDASWIDKIPRYVFEEILRKELSKLSLKEIDDMIEEAEKIHGKSLVDIGLELSCSEELSQQERVDVYETLKKYIRVKNIDFRFN